MESNRRWLGWVAIGISGVALLVALFGRGFGQQGAAMGMSDARAPQAYAQQGVGQPGPGQQGGQPGPGANAQPGSGQQGGRPRGGPGTNAQPGGQQGAGPQGSQGNDMRRGADRSGGAGFGLGGLLRFPFKLLGGTFQMGMLALLIVLGVWLLRGRSTGRAARAQAPAPEPQSPTGESYTNE